MDIMKFLMLELVHLPSQTLLDAFMSTQVFYRLIHSNPLQQKEGL